MSDTTTLREAPPNYTAQQSNPQDKPLCGTKEGQRLLRPPEVESRAILAVEACRAFIPTRQNARQTLHSLIRAVGFQNTSSLTSIPSWKLAGWLAGQRTAMYPCERKLIWLMHRIVTGKPLRSLFDIATFGRYMSEETEPLTSAKKAKRKRKPVVKKA